ncbi:penicillin acylase family protein [Pleomorphovibrio marinus]|uniref:penicillin acylase family protein n=1 Tax=Pleomorphovibrio marinus TaxID=2164132 RepID=UPI000E0BCCAA|nr:penicillin acylase family protein [Pleomorphovibrio marinus]
MRTIYLAFCMLLMGKFLFAQDTADVEILWDKWGIPHIYAQDHNRLFYAYGWAQAQNHGKLILELYGQARGRGAEYWGEEYLEADKWVLTNEVYERSANWFSGFDSEWQEYLNDFAAGINDYATQNPDQIGDKFRQVLPISGIDVLAHCHRVTHFAFLASPARVNAALALSGDDLGSNAWAIGPSKSASGNTFLLTNPHLPWTGYFTYFEAHLNSPQTNAYGISRIGFPVLTMAFNPDAGYAQTVNTHDGQDLYALSLHGAGYLWDGEERAFETHSTFIKIKREDGEMDSISFQVEKSVHGPVVEKKGNKAFALRVVGLNQSGMLQQYWDMCRARNHGEFISAIQGLQIPMYTFMFADREGNIFNLFNARVPKKPMGDWAFWEGVVRGDTSATLWWDYHAFEDLPQVLNPPTGWLQNTNEPPWTATWPPINRAEYFPDYMAPEMKMSFRTMRSIQMLIQNDSITMESLEALKHDSYLLLEKHILEDLIEIARGTGEEFLIKAADVLEKWDKLAKAESEGAILFDHFVREWVGGATNLRLLDNLSERFEHPWDEHDPWNTPRGIEDKEKALKSLKKAAQEVEKRYGDLSIPWGEVFRFRWDGQDLPGNGGPGPMGAFRTMTLREDEDGKFIPAHGDTYVALVEFGDPIRVRGLTSYGNASQPGSPFAGKQLPLLRDRVLRDVYLDRERLAPEIVEVTRFD